MLGQDQTNTSNRNQDFYIFLLCLKLNFYNLELKTSFLLWNEITYYCSALRKKYYFQKLHINCGLICLSLTFSSKYNLQTLHVRTLRTVKLKLYKLNIVTVLTH